MRHALAAGAAAGVVMLALLFGATTAMTAAEPARAPMIQPQVSASAWDTATTAAFVEAYYAVLNTGDLDGVFRMWSREMPGRGQMAGALAHQFARERPVFSDVTITRTVLDGDRARLTIALTFQSRPTAAALADAANSSATVSVGTSPTPAAPPASSATATRAPDIAPAAPMPSAPSTPALTQALPLSPPQPRRTVFLLAREEGAWKLFAEKSVVQDLADRLMETTDEAAADRFADAEIFPERGASPAVSRALLAAFGQAMAQQRFNDAPRPAERALHLAEVGKARGDGLSALFDSLIAQAWTARGLLFLYKRPGPEPERAMEPLGRALAIYEAGGDRTGIADVEQALATASYGIADYPNALAHWERARTLQRDLGDTGAVVRATLGIANVRYLFAQFDLARQAYDEALMMAAPYVELSDSATFALQGLGRVFVGLGDYARGRDYHARALAQVEKTGSRDQQVPVLQEIGRADFLRGRLDEARASYVKALAIGEELKDFTRQGDVLQAIALVEVVNGAPDTAIATYTRAMAAYAQSTARREAELGTGHALLGRASVWLDARDATRALADFVDSQARFETVKDVEGLARARLGQAMAHVIARQPQPALAAADAASAAADALDLADLRWQARLEAGRAWLLSGDPQKAKAAFDEAVRALEASRLEAVSDARTPARRAAPYAALVEWQIAHGDAEAALIAAEDGKRRVLEDLLQPHRARLTRGLDPARATEEGRLIGRRVSLLAQLRHERERKPVDAGRIAALQQALQEARAASEAWQRDLARDLPAVPFTRGESRLTSLDPLGQALADDAALIHFVSSDERLSVVVATVRTAATAAANADAAATSTSIATATGDAATRSRLDVRGYTREVTRADLAKRVWAFADAIARDTPDAGAPATIVEARALYDLLLGPARDQLAGRSTLVVVPDDVLWLLPFEALDPTVVVADASAAGEPAPAAAAATAAVMTPAMAAPRYLTEAASITYLPSATTWLTRPADPVVASTHSAANNADAAKPVAMDESAQPRIRWASAEIIDVSPLQSTVTLTPADAAAARVGPSAASASTQPVATRPAATLPAATLPVATTPAATAPAATSPASTAPASSVPASAASASAASASPPSALAGSPQQSATSATGSSARDLSRNPLSGARTAAEWLSESLTDDLTIVDTVTQSPARLRLDVGRLGAAAVAWALATAGSPRTLLARRALDPAAHARATRAVTAALAAPSSLQDVAGAVRAAMSAARADRASSEPRHWAIWLPIGPPPAR